MYKRHPTTGLFPFTLKPFILIHLNISDIGATQYTAQGHSVTPRRAFLQPSPTTFLLNDAQSHGCCISTPARRSSTALLPSARCYNGCLALEVLVPLLLRVALWDSEQDGCRVPCKLQLLLNQNKFLTDL